MRLKGKVALISGGARGMGALEFESAQFKTGKRTFAIEVKSLVEIAQKMLSNRMGFEVNLHRDEQQAMTEILKIGTSAGGARPKVVIAFNKKNRGGAIRPDHGSQRLRTLVTQVRWCQ